MPPAPSTLLRPGLLADRLVLAAPGPERAEVCRALGAEIAVLEAPALDEDAMAAAVPSGAYALVVDAAAMFAGGLTFALDASWCAVRAAVNAAFIPGGGGKVVLVAPRPEAQYAQGLRAGLENLARCSSIEWAQYAITPTAILPGPETSDAEVGELVAYLVSPAGDYFSGCAFPMT